MQQSPRMLPRENERLLKSLAACESLLTNAHAEMSRRESSISSPSTTSKKVACALKLAPLFEPLPENRRRESKPKQTKLPVFLTTGTSSDEQGRNVHSTEDERRWSERLDALRAAKLTPQKDDEGRRAVSFSDDVDAAADAAAATEEPPCSPSQDRQKRAKQEAAQIAKRVSTARRATPEKAVQPPPAPATPAPQKKKENVPARTSSYEKNKRNKTSFFGKSSKKAPSPRSSAPQPPSSTVSVTVTVEPTKIAPLQKPPQPAKKSFSILKRFSTFFKSSTKKTKKK